MSEIERALKQAEEQIELAERLDDIPAAAEAQRNAIYILLRELLLEIHALRAGRPT